MSDLHQYEISYNYRDHESHFHTGKILIWAYTVQEACFQLELQAKNIVIMKAGPVTDTITRASLPFHYHFCPECKGLMTCATCAAPDESDHHEPCRKCMGKKSHRHSCCICEAEYECTWIEKNTSCSHFDQKQVPCGKHTFEEAHAYFTKKLAGGTEATP